MNDACGRKRILFITGTLQRGGIERQVVDLSIALQATGRWQVTVCCILAKRGPYVATLQEHGIPVFECKLSRRKIVTFPVRFSKFVRHIAPDLVHSHVHFSLLWQVMGARLGAATKIIVTQHNGGRAWSRNLWRRLRIVAYYKTLRSFVSAYTAVSENVMTSFTSLVMTPAGDWTVIHNPVDVERFRFSPQSKVLARQEMGFTNGEYVIGTVGSMREEKGHRYFLDAAKKLIKANPEMRFALIGDGALRGKLESQIQSSGLAEFVTLLGNRDDVARLLNGFDCFTLPSLSEGFPVALLEAMACEVPVVATDAGGVAEALADGECGVVIPAGDSEALAQAIIKMKKNTSDAKRMSANALKRVREKYSLSAAVDNYHALYQRILSDCC